MLEDTLFEVHQKVDWVYVYHELCAALAKELASGEPLQVVRNIKNSAAQFATALSVRKNDPQCQSSTHTAEREKFETKKIKSGHPQARK